MSNHQIAEKWVKVIMLYLGTDSRFHDPKPVRDDILSAINEATAEQQKIVTTIEARQKASGEREIEHQKRIEELEKAHDDAYISGLEAYAWYEDGVQYVGTCGHTFAHAVHLFLAGKAHGRIPICAYLPAKQDGSETTNSED